MSNRHDAQLNHKLKSYMAKSYVKYLHNNIDVEDNALVYNDLSSNVSDLNREVGIAKTSTSSSTSMRMTTGSPPPPDTTNVYECLQIEISAGIDLNFDVVPRLLRLISNAPPIAMIKKSDVRSTQGDGCDINVLMGVQNPVDNLPFKAKNRLRCS